MTALAPSKNVQKQRKANPQIDERQNVYWDLRGRYQEEYDKRLDEMPDHGKGPTKASEIFRAASKTYYDFWNNAMVNNTSGAVNFLLYVGVFASQNDPDFAAIYPYTTGSKIYLNNEMGLRFTMERMLDRTIAFLNSNEEFDNVTNDLDYLDFTQKSEMRSLDRCTVRNIHFLQMNQTEAETDTVVALEEGTDETLTKATSKAQDSSTTTGMKKKKKRKKKRVPTAKNLVNIMNGISISPISKRK